MVSEVVVFVLLYSICCSIIEDRVCVFGVCYCCDISTEIPHRIFVVAEGAFTVEKSQQLVTVKILVINLVTDGVVMNNPAGVNLNKSGVNLWLALPSECHNICNEW